MKLSITERIGNTILFGKNYPANFVSAKGMEKAEVNLSWPLGKSRFLEHWFEGMHITKAELLPEGLSTLEIQTHTPVFILLFCLHGQLGGKVLGRKTQEFELTPNQAIFISTPSYSMEVTPQRRSKTICIRITPDCFMRLNLKNSKLLLSDHLPIFKITAEMQLILNTLLDCKYPESMTRIFMEAKILELIFLLLRQQNSINSQHQLTQLKRSELESIQFAKRLIEQNMGKPYSIMELARKSGLNDFKLKKGFKQVMGTTVFGYLNEVRMEKAKQLLCDEKRTVKDVADEVGYKNPHHFTVAFKKRYGVLPSQLNK